MLITLIGCEHLIKVDGDLEKPVPELPLLENKLHGSSVRMSCGASARSYRTDYRQMCRRTLPIAAPRLCFLFM